MWAYNSCCKERGDSKEYREGFKGEEKSAGIDFCMLAGLTQGYLIERFFKCVSLVIIRERAKVTVI